MSSNRTTPDDSFIASDEIELIPTQVANAETAPVSISSRPSITSFSMARDTEQLLHNRLLALAALFALYSCIRLGFSLYAPDSGEGQSVWISALRVIVSIGVAVFLARQPDLNLKALRLVEYGFFGFQALSTVGAQYIVGNELIARGDAAAFVAFEKNGIFRMLVIMLLYGVLIPNKLKTVASVAMTMALGPILALAALYAGNPSSPVVQHAEKIGLVLSDSLYTVMGAGLAVYASYLIQGLRKELHDARRLGPYELGEKLGEGGMGEVYMAQHQLLKRPCALKLIRASAQSNPVALARFEREVQAAATLTHPNSIQIYDYGHTPNGTFYYVMEYLPGLSLHDLIYQFGELPPGRAIYILRQACRSLAEAHRLGMVHRDLKPANIFVALLGGQCDVAKVLDFGLVKVTEDPQATRLTAETSVSGTPAYMSPEQATGSRNVDARADIYALGAILYFVLTGRPPFDKESPVALLVAQVSEPVVPPSSLNPSIPQDLEAVVLKCLSKDPADRYANADELAAALAACRSAGEWNDALAEQWWVEEANRQQPLETVTA